MAAHRTRVMPLPDSKYAAVCTCGWFTKETAVKQTAQLSANSHTFEALKNNDPSKQLDIEKTPKGKP